MKLGTEQTTASNYPTNSKLLEMMESTRRALEQERTENIKLDDRGKRLAYATEKFVLSTEQLIEERNRDEKLQTFISHVVDLSQRAKDEVKHHHQGEQGQVEEIVKTFAERLRDLTKQLLTSSEFRNMILELIEVMDKIFWKLTHKINLKKRTKEMIKEDNPQEREEMLKETGQQLKEVTKQSLSEIPRQDKIRLVETLRSILVKIGSNPEYRSCSDDFFALFDFFRSKQENIDPSLRIELTDLYYEAMEILREFIGHKDLKPLENDFWELYRRLYEDQETRDYFYRLRTWSNGILNHPERFDEQKITEEGNELIDRGTQLMQGKYDELLHKINSEFSDILKRLQTDKYAKVFSSELMEVRQAFSGSSVFQTLSQVRYLALPVIKELLRELHLPTIQTQTETTSYLIDNMILEGKEITLDDVRVSVKFGLKDIMKLEFLVKNIQATIHDVHFTYDNSGIINWHDEGTFNCSLTIPKWKLKWIVKEIQNQPPQFFLERVDGNISQFDIEIKEAQHKLVDKVYVALFSDSIKKKTELEIENALKEQAQIITEKLNGLFFKDEQPLQKTPISIGEGVKSPIRKSVGKPPVTMEIPPTL